MPKKELPPLLQEAMRKSALRTKEEHDAILMQTLDEIMLEHPIPDEAPPPKQ